MDKDVLVNESLVKLVLEWERRRRELLMGKTDMPSACRPHREGRSTKPDWESDGGRWIPEKDIQCSAKISHVLELRN